MRIYQEIGDLALVPPERRISGLGASWVMAAFTHVSPDRTSRFSDGSYGVYYAGDSLETALREHAFHMGRFYAEAGMTAAWISEVRQLIGTIDADLIDIRGSGFAELLDPDDYGPSQAFGRAQRAAEADGIVFPSVRDPGGACIAAFFPDVVTAPVQADHFRYYWNGGQVSYVRKVSDDRAIYQLRPTTRQAPPRPS